MIARNIGIVSLPFLVQIYACGNQDSKTFSRLSQSQESPKSFQLNERTIQVLDPSKQSHIELEPYVKFNDRWVGVAPDCFTTDEAQTCAFADFGTLSLEPKAGSLKIKFTATRSVLLQGLSLQGLLQMSGARGWLSNGFQSWSQTGLVSFKEKPNADALRKALAQTGEAEVYRGGTEFSWWYSFLGSDALSFLAGATTAQTLRSYVQFEKQGDTDYMVKLISGAGEQVALEPGQSVEETWFMALGPSLQEHLDAYAQAMDSRKQRKPQAPLLGWNSWYNLWDDVKESDLRAQIDPILSFWQQRGKLASDALTLTLDDGWQEKWGDWNENSKFPGKLAGLAETLKAKGLRLGLWIAPFLVDPDSRTAREHPEWLVPEIYYANPTGKRFRVLDVSQTAVAEHLQATIRRLLAAGVSQLKIDFLFAGALEGRRFKPMTGMQAYHEGLRLIREAAGENTPIFAVGAPPLATFSYVDGWRVGGDIAFKPAFLGIPRPGVPFIANQARSLAGRQPFCQITLCDADPALLRSADQGMVQAGAWVAAAAGGAMVLSDNLLELEKKRWDWAYDLKQLSNGLSSQPARLESYFPAEVPDSLNSMKDGFFTARAHVPEIWVMPDGTRVAINFEHKAKMIGGREVPAESSAILP